MRCALVHITETVFVLGTDVGRGTQVTMKTLVNVDHWFDFSIKYEL
jgi:hypothetical protein